MPAAGPRVLLGPSNRCDRVPGTGKRVHDPASRGASDSRAGAKASGSSRIALEELTWDRHAPGQSQECQRCSRTREKGIYGHAGLCLDLEHRERRLQATGQQLAAADRPARASLLCGSARACRDGTRAAVALEGQEASSRDRAPGQQGVSTWGSPSAIAARLLSSNVGPIG